MPRQTPLLAFAAGALAIGVWLGFAADPPITRTIAFDNTYRATAALVVHVRVDGEGELRLNATCDEKTCKFRLPLRNGRHQLSLAVEQFGQRGRATTLTIDTSKLPLPSADK